MRDFWLLLVVVTCALCLPAVAIGQERARPDPDSPAGVEYQLPLDQARDDAAGKGKGEAGGREDPPLFGSGITESRSKPGAGASGRSTPVTRKRKSGEAPPRRGRVAAASATSEGGSGASVPLIAAAVLIVGGALGLGLRRGMGSTHKP